MQRVRNKNNKAVIASMGTVAASGGYYIAAATDRIIANPGTLTGSIGVIMETANVEGLLKKIGVEGIVIKSGKFKDVGSPLRKMTVEEQALLQSVMDDVHKQFIEAVAEGRALEVSTVQALADGRIFTGRQAKEAKFVDELGNLEDAIQLAAELGRELKGSRKSWSHDDAFRSGNSSSPACRRSFRSWISIPASVSSTSWRFNSVEAAGRGSPSERGVGHDEGADYRACL